MKNLIKVLIISIYIIYGNIIFSDEYASRMNSYENTITPESLQGISNDDLMAIESYSVEKTHSKYPYVKVFIRYERTFHQVRVIYQCDYSLYDYEDAYTSVRDCLYDFLKERNYKHYQDLVMPSESSKLMDIEGKQKYITQYVRYVKVYN